MFRLAGSPHKAPQYCPNLGQSPVCMRRSRLYNYISSEHGAIIPREPGTYSSTHVFTRFDASCPHCYSRVKTFLKDGWLLFISACLRSIHCTLAAIFSTTMTVAPLDKCLCVVYIFGTTSVASVHINKTLVCEIIMGDSHNNESEIRQKIEKRTKTPVIKPKCIEEYNLNLGAVDRSI
ncbi:hypothetical protein J6590_080022 [Homalodisca vitripennis]|nr:hypothetical protein J6590_080022 [Homalodisca vitripennis]